MPVPLIDALPPAPLPTDTPPSVFVTKAAAQVAAQAVMVGQINTATAFVNERATAAEGAAGAADQDAIDAMSYRNQAGAHATNASTSAANAATSEANAAASAAALKATSASNVAIATGSATFATQTGKQFAPGMFVLVASAATPTKYMHGQVTSYAAGSLVVNVTAIGGTGSAADWVISVSGAQGPTGAAGSLAGGTMTGALNYAPITVLASAATVDIGAVTSNVISITGTTTITALGTITAGAERAVTFAGALTLTHNGASLILPGAANIVTAAGDCAHFISLGDGAWRCTGYQRASGQAVKPPELKTVGGQSIFGAGDLSVGVSVGDLITTARDLTTPTYLPCNGSTYLQSSYAALYAELGLIGQIVWGASTPKLTDPATPPTNVGYGVAWSPSGDYLAVAHLTHPGVTIYQRSSTTLTKLSDPATLPGGSAYSCTWDGSSTYLAVGHTSSPRLTVYERNGSVFTKLADPATLPPDYVNGCAWDASGTYLATVFDSSPYVYVYQRSGSTLTKLSDLSPAPAGMGKGCAWDPTGTYLAIAHSTAPYVTVYRRSGASFTKLTNPATLPPNVAAACAWDPSGTYLAVGGYGTPYLNIYKRVGTSLTRLTDPADMPSTSVLACTWDTTGNYLSIGFGNTARVYERVGDSFAALPDPSSPVTNTIRGLSWNSAVPLLAVCGEFSPFVSVFSAYGYDTSTQFKVPTSKVAGGTTYIKAQ